uniref:Uncharacterized protein LOC111107741 n=1 Tax=Crassostrea virginica TaxID=6565 RepID=A0A8B8B5V4_CRAVI|nr:uncharacterized protein LOC111107741 [Crassostrea virginica]
MKLQVAPSYLVYAGTEGPFIRLTCTVALIDDIERHGAPTAYDEDSFEKNHGRNRDQISLQNQKARRRDTASKYAQHVLCHHLVTGGYFKHGERWIQASATPVHAGCDPVVEA